MPTCNNCGSTFPNTVVINGKVRNLSSRKFCLECSPFGRHNTSGYVDDSKRQPEHCTCSDCGRHYVYNKKKGHSKTLCNSCRITRRRNETKAKAIEYKGGKCVICGYDKCSSALTFHHLDPNEKEFTIGGSEKQYLSFEAIKKELDKCVLLCFNCHMELHAGATDLPEQVA